MIAPRLKFLLETAGLLFGGIALLLVFVAWRVASGPVRLDVARPFIEAKIRHRTGIDSEFGHLAVGASDFAGPFTVELSGFAATLPNGGGNIVIDNLELTLSLRDLVHGRVRPITLKVVHPVVHLRRTIPKAAGIAPPAAQNKSLLDRLLKPETGDPLALWREAVITDGAVDMTNARGEVIATVENVEAQLKRQPVGASLRVNGSLAGKGGNGLLNLTAQYDESGRGTLQFHSDPLPIDMLASISPDMAIVNDIEIPVGVTGTGTLQDASLIEMQGKVVLGAGTIADAARFPAPIAVTGGTVSVSYKARGKVAKIDDLHVAFAGFTLDGKAVATLGDTLGLTADAAVTGLHIDDFGKYWPADAAAGGRRWVLANVSGGVVDQATLHLAGVAPGSDLDNFQVDSLSGTMKATGITVHYFGKLPDVTQTAATIDYDDKSMTIHLLGGDDAGLAIRDGTVRLDGFNQHDQSINIDLDLTGPVAAAMRILDSDPLHYGRKLGVNLNAIRGSAETRFHVDFPLIADLPASAVNLNADATLQGAALPKIVHGLDLTELDGHLAVGVHGLTVDGHGMVGNIPMDLVWNQDFDRKAHLQSEAYVAGTLDDVQRATLGIDTPDRLSGVVAVKGHYQDFGGAGRLGLDLGLKRADFRIDEIGYDKPRGTAGRAVMTIQLDHGTITRIDDIDVQAENLSALGFAQLDEEGKLARLHIQPLRIGATDVRVDILENQPGTRIDVAGEVLDTRQFLHKPRDKERDKAPTATDNAPPLQINADIGWLQASSNDGLRNVKASVTIADHRWQNATIAAMAKGHPLVISYLADDGPNPGFTLNADADDLGAVLAALDQTDSIHGGQFHMDARRQPATDDEPFPPMTGSFAMGKFQVVRPPIFARLFDLLSLQGLMETLQGRGIEFDRLSGKFLQNGDYLRVEDGRVEGSAIGLTVAGSVDRASDKLDLRGVAVPAYGINTFLNNIPLLGLLFTGGDGEGVFSTTYSITGTIDKPSVFVNPASIFAPGVLRTLFFELPFGHRQSDEIPG